MQPHSRKATLLAVIFVLVFSACATLIPPTPTAVPTATSTATSTATLTPTVTPSSTPTPTATKLPPCDADQTLKNLKSRIPYDEFSIQHHSIQGTWPLLTWFVDPELDPAPEQSEIEENRTLAMRHAVRLSEELKAADRCVSELFDMTMTIVVDKNYNSWLSGQINTSDLPDTVDTTDEQLDQTARLYETTYLREKVPARPGSAPAGSCTWAEANENIHRHFSAERENVTFFLIHDETRVTVWAQWDSQPDMLMLNMPASLLNIALELECLFPRPDHITFAIVDEDGEVQIAGVWEWADAKKQDISKIQVLYSK